MPRPYHTAISFATEEQELAETIYHYLKAEGLSVFYAPAPECQAVLSGENQREVFCRIFGLESEYVVLLVSKHYVLKKVPMEEARIAFSKHNGDGRVLPIYIDGTALPRDLLDPGKQNYFSSCSAAEIADHVAKKVKKTDAATGVKKEKSSSDPDHVMINKGNAAGTQIFIQNYR